MTGRSVPAQPDAADPLSPLRERGPEAEPAGDEPSPAAEAPSFPSLAGPRDRERGPWPRLAASAAAQALGGPW